MVTPAELLAPLLRDLVGADLPIRIRCWDGSEVGPGNAPAMLMLNGRRALRTLLWQPDELGLGRAYVAGDLDIVGDLYAALDVPELLAKVSSNDGLSLRGRQKLRALATAVRLGAVGMRPPLPPEEVRPPRRRRRLARKHAVERDAEAVRHHYDVSNDFYRLVLGPSMVYSCAYWTQEPGPTYTLEQAQHDKLELVCRKLGLSPGMRLLDVGCGWGALVVHAARHHGVHAVGVTLSPEQAALAGEQIGNEGLADRVQVRVQDYRHITDGPFDAIASVGRSEHVGATELPGYCRALFALLAPGGRLLNHAISSPPSGDEGLVEPRSSFIDRYVFPDGELVPVGMVVDGLERAGFEVRDSQNLREHYALTARAWVTNLEQHWDTAIGHSSQGRARVWKLYLVASALAFTAAEIGVHQVLAVKNSPRGTSGLPRTREQWEPRIR